MFRQAYLYFILLLLVLMVGFWPSYFSRLNQQHSFAQHFHSVIMLLWCLLLISQAWLMRHKRFSVHKQMGRLSFILGPLVVVSATYVAFDFIGKVPLPHPEQVLAFHWFGLFLAALFLFLFAMAIYHRKTPALHARYMIATAFVFLMPGFGRAVSNISDYFGYQPPNFLLLLMLPFLIGVLLIISDYKKRQNSRPFIYFTLAWGINVYLFAALPKMQWWVDFSAWCQQLMV
ncbi:hypothetical protein [Thalassotalea mangrovi]|uniref:DUF2306 domain-containing protein n=1 Tax=Thalassotalea mangrovi TaxID=2572245 RepID=A0A4V5NW14_9GAMM|nr:hypothetical protein [Thalassotalea mangrovi]TKB44503.1 hypothetical protein E8M12_11465 [Thalassotalea mangrovi]